MPQAPGVYIMKSFKGEVLYVGKANSLKKRVNSYFHLTNSLKTAILLEKIADIEYIECVSPEQALVLEAALIKEKKPKYNISLRDNKSYPYVEITSEKFPRVFISRPKLKNKSIFFGPYPKVKEIKTTLLLVRKIFPYRSCKAMPKSVCLFFHLGICPGPCIGKISSREYQETIIKSISRILKGERRSLIRGLKIKMNRLSQEKKFEAAAYLRDTLVTIKNLYSGSLKDHEIMSLKETLKLSSFPLYIEAVDISSLGDKDSVGSVVVFRDGVADKSSYRRFLIKNIQKRDDYAMIEEVMRRRYTRLKREAKTLPDLIVVDGGRTHAMRAESVIQGLNLSLPVIGIAKKNEEIWFPHKSSPLSISRSKSCLHLIQRIRDEAHRFAHSYQLLRRRRSTFKNKVKSRRKD